MSEQERSGGCLCGAVRFTARGAPKRVGICHCTTCQKNAGSAFFCFAVYPLDAVALTGALKTHKAPTVERRFCPDCGSLICLQDEPDEIDLAIGAFDGDPGFRPDYELFDGSRHPWVPRVPGTRRYAANRGGKPLEEA